MANLNSVNLTWPKELMQMHDFLLDQWVEWTQLVAHSTCLTNDTPQGSEGSGHHNRATASTPILLYVNAQGVHEEVWHCESRVKLQCFFSWLAMYKYWFRQWRLIIKICSYLMPLEMENFKLEIFILLTIGFTKQWLCITITVDRYEHSPSLTALPQVCVHILLTTMAQVMNCSWRL